MQAVLVLLGQVLARIAEALGILSVIQGFVAKTAQEHIAYQIEATVTATSLNVANPTYGLAALHTDLAAAVTAINAHTDAALDGLQVQATIPDQPSWYTAPTTPPDAEAIAIAVWSLDLPVRDLNQDFYLLPANQWAVNIWDGLALSLGFKGVPIPGNPFWNMVGATPVDVRTYFGDYGYQAHNPDVPVCDVSTIQAGDTAYSWLAREYSGFTYKRSLPNTQTGDVGIFISSSSSHPSYAYRFNLTDADVAAMWPVTVEPPEVPTAVVPPVWPGASGVTLGTTVALTSQLYLVDEMDGVIVAITTPPNRTGLYSVGGAPLDYGQGRIAFETDSGDLEPWQYLGFRTAIYTPKSMAHASGVRFQCLAGAAGTVTPWTVTP